MITICHKMGGVKSHNSDKLKANLSFKANKRMIIAYITTLLNAFVVIGYTPTL